MTKTDLVKKKAFMIGALLDIIFAAVLGKAAKRFIKNRVMRIAVVSSLSYLIRKLLTDQVVEKISWGES